MRFTVVLLLLVANCSFGQPPIASDASNSTSPIVRGQPIRLLADNSLEGWTNGNGEAPGQGWSVVDGVLHRSDKHGGDLYHEHWYQDFELELDFKIAENGNSGIKYRVQRYGKRNLGCEFQVQDDKGRDHNKHATGALYAVYEPSPNKKPIEPMQWHTAKIVICGKKIEHWLDGELVVNARSGSLQWLQRVEKSKFRDEPFFGQNREGRIFLQDHGSQVWYRNIVVTPLSCACGS